MVARGVAELLPDGSLSMIEADPRFDCRRPSAQAPILDVIPMPEASIPRSWSGDVGHQSFLPYPQPSKTYGRGLRHDFPGLSLGLRKKAA
jgi:hypothetical protein